MVIYTNEKSWLEKSDLGIKCQSEFSNSSEWLANYEEVFGIASMIKNGAKRPFLDSANND